MKQKRAAVKRKLGAVDPQFESNVNEVDPMTEMLVRELSRRRSDRLVALDKPLLNKKTTRGAAKKIESDSRSKAAEKLPRVIDSSRSKAAGKSPRVIVSSRSKASERVAAVHHDGIVEKDTISFRQAPPASNKASERVAVHHDRIVEKQTKSSRLAPVPVCNKQELDAALLVIRKIMTMNGATPFNTPVDPIALGIPDYFDIIDVPMDFGTICSNLEKGLEYKNSEDVFKDVQRIWDNCCKYNKKGSPILEVMKRVKNNFMKQWTIAGLYKEQQTVSKGHMPQDPELYSDSANRHEEPMHAYPVDSTVSGCAHLHRHDFSCLNKIQYQPLSPCSAGTFNPHQISHQCPCSLHPGGLHHGHHHQDVAPRHNHYTHLPSVDLMNDNLCNQRVIKASPNLTHSYQPSPSCCAIGYPQQGNCLHQSSSSQLPSSQLQFGRICPSIGQYAGDRNHQPHQMDSFNVQAYQPSTNCMPTHQFNQSTSQQLDSVHVQAYQPSTNCMPTHQLNQSTSPQLDSFRVQAYQPSANCMPAHQFNQSTSPQLDSFRVQAYQPSANCMPAHQFNQSTSQQLDPVHVQASQPSTNCMPTHQFNQSTSQQLDPVHVQASQPSTNCMPTHQFNQSTSQQLDPVHVQAYQPSADCMPAHQFNLSTSQQLPRSRTENGRNIGLEGNLNVGPPIESTMNRRKPKTGCSSPPLTDNSSCEQPDQINSTSEQTASMINMGGCHSPQLDHSPSERLNSRSYNNSSKKDTQVQEHAHCQEETSFMKNSEEGEPGQNSYHKTSFLQSQPSPPVADCNLKSKKKSRGRGPARGLQFREGERIPVSTNEQGQPVGPEARKYISFLGTLARNGYFLPLTYHDWRSVPSEYKENMWREVQLRFDIDPISKDSAMHSISHAWRNWKCLLKTAHYYPHKTDEERLADRDERVPPDQWAGLIAIWNSEVVEERCAKIRAKRLEHKMNHVTGSTSTASVRQEQKRTNRSDRNHVNVETSKRQLHEAAKDKVTLQESYKQSDVLSEIISPDKNGRTEATKTVSEENTEIRNMKEKMTVMEQTCAQMASQMAAMMSMMSSMHRNAPDKNVPDMIVNTSGALDPSLPRQVPIMHSPGASSNFQGAPAGADAGCAFWSP